MTDSTEHDSVNQAKDGDRSSNLDAQVLAELCQLLNSEQTVNQPSQPRNNSATDADTEALSQLRQLLFNNEEAAANQQLSANLSADEEETLTELRDLLFGPELQERLKKTQVLAEDVSRVLPEAIILRTLQDEQLTKAVVPTVEQAIQNSVKQDLNVLADSLFPVMGPATRKAVSTALKSLTESMNQTLDRSLSPESFKWRLEALQTGKSFAEVVVLRTLVYRVEQVFLIHRQTGLLLQYAVADAVAAQDADLVSAMLKAIQDFVQDSFSVSQNEGLNTLEFGELTIWIEQGPQAILAGVIRGNAPQELRLVFQTTLENIHKKFRSALHSFQGDDAAFESTQQYLEACLQTQYQAKKDKPSPILFILAGLIFCSLGLWGWFSFQERQRWTTFLEKLNSQPGIVVVNAEKHWGKYFISGLRDPLAVEPIALIQAAKLNPKAVSSSWEPYVSLHSRFTVTRAKRLLQPPETVLLKADNNGIVSAAGTAPRQWIVRAKQLAPNIPGVAQFRTEELIEVELKELQLIKARIENQVLYFASGGTQLLPTENTDLQTVVGQIRQLIDTALLFNKDVRVEIIGHTDDNGSQERNLRLSQARANAILSLFVSQGLKANNLTTRGVGAQELLQAAPNQNQDLNRRVSFKVFLTDAPKGDAAS